MNQLFQPIWGASEQIRKCTRPILGAIAYTESIGQNIYTICGKQGYNRGKDTP